MSKERARRRAAREAEAAQVSAARETQNASLARRRARADRWRRVLPAVPRRSGSTGLLAAKRRRALGLLATAFFFLQFLTWVSTPDWGVRGAVLLVSLFALPVVAVLSS